ncbi:hypothetical protein AAE02nite_18430 [Adhaeribacter aerolatus]|uniref:FHA domain-containing protein n=2 Tax=Adhaeribacter aerolatus TaxID=670289 RepID=A0A512AWT2_9BACT|nr:hypothetical protein AAE02nite_18430 [Adhaeribacter aerolatus]
MLDAGIYVAMGGSTIIPVFSGLYFLSMIIPGLAVTVRRLHDTGKSGWFYFISLIPLIGAIWLFVLMVTDSDFGENQYGLNPKENTQAGFNAGVVPKNAERENWGYNTPNPVPAPVKQERLYGWVVQLSGIDKPFAFPIKQALTLIGREAGAIGGTNGIIKIENDGLVSRKHAAIRVEPKPSHIDFVLEDLESANGTFVMNTKTKVQPGQPFFLSDGDQIKTGNTLLIFKTAVAAPTERDAIYSARKAVLDQV